MSDIRDEQEPQAEGVSVEGITVPRFPEGTRALLKEAKMFVTVKEVIDPEFTQTTNNNYEYVITNDAETFTDQVEEGELEEVPAYLQLSDAEFGEAVREFFLRKARELQSFDIERFWASIIVESSANSRSSVSIQFCVADYEYSSTSKTKGCDVGSVFFEYVRRHGWNDANERLLIAQG